MAHEKKSDRLQIVALQHEEAADDMMLYERFDEAIVHFRKADGLLADAGDHEARFRVLISLARSFRLSRNDDAARDALTSAATCADRAEMPQLRLKATVFLAQIQEDLGARREAVALWHEVLAGGAYLDSSFEIESLMATAHGRLAELALGQGDADAAELHLGHCETLATRLEDAEAGAGALVTRGRLLRLRGDVAGADNQFQAALHAYGQLRDLPKIASTLGQIGNIKRESGDLRGAQRIFESSLVMAESGSDAVAAASALTNLANIAVALDDPETARKRYAEVIDVAAACGHQETLLGALVNLGNLEASAGNTKMAKARYEQGLEAAETLGVARLEIDIGMLIAQLDGRDGALDAAETRVRALLQRAEGLRYHVGVARLRVNLASIRQVRGSLRDAASGFRDGLKAFEQLGRPLDAVAAGLALIDAALLGGDLALAASTVRDLRPLIADPAQRESLDLDLAEARAAHAAGPNDETLGRLLILAAVLDHSARPIAALGARLEVLDAAFGQALPEGLEGDIVAQGGMATLEAPLRIEKESLLARQRGDLGYLDSLIDEATSAGLPLLALRVGRRACQCLAALGDPVFDARLAPLVAQAQAMAYGAEFARLTSMSSDSRPS